MQRTLMMLGCIAIVLSATAVEAESTPIKYYAYDSHGSVLYELDPANNWAARKIGDTDLDVINAADFSLSGRLFVVGRKGGQTVLAEIDPSTGEIIGEPRPFPEYTEAMAFDGNYLVYYVSNYKQIKTFNLCTGAVNVLDKPIGIDEVQAIDFTREGELFGISSHTGEHPFNTLLRIDPCTGEGTKICPPLEEGEELLPDINSLDINALGSFHAVSTSERRVYRIRPKTCTVEIVGEIGLELQIGALASVNGAAGYEPCDTNLDGSVDLTDVEAFIDCILR